MYDKAHGYRGLRTREEYLVRTFPDRLRDDDVRFEMEFNKEPETLAEAVYDVVNFMQTRGVAAYDRRYKYTPRTLYKQFNKAGGAKLKP